jgi:hypothetical protein
VSAPPRRRGLPCGERETVRPPQGLYAGHAPQRKRDDLTVEAATSARSLAALQAESAASARSLAALQAESATSARSLAALQGEASTASFMLSSGFERNRRRDG